MQQGAPSAHALPPAAPHWRTQLCACWQMHAQCPSGLLCFEIPTIHNQKLAILTSSMVMSQLDTTIMRLRRLPRRVRYALRHATLHKVTMSMHAQISVANENSPHNLQAIHYTTAERKQRLLASTVQCGG